MSLWGWGIRNLARLPCKYGWHIPGPTQGKQRDIHALCWRNKIRLKVGQRVHTGLSLECVVAQNVLHGIIYIHVPWYCSTCRWSPLFPFLWAPKTTTQMAGLPSLVFPFARGRWYILLLKWNLRPPSCFALQVTVLFPTLPKKPQAVVVFGAQVNSISVSPFTLILDEFLKNMT